MDLALATTQAGFPIGYELFEENKAEVTTLVVSSRIREIRTFGSEEGSAGVVQPFYSSLSSNLGNVTPI